MKEPFKNIPTLKNEWDFVDLFCFKPGRGSSVISCGYPADGSESHSTDITVSKGEILSTWSYNPKALSAKKDPKEASNSAKKLKGDTIRLLNSNDMLILMSNMIFSGNSGGPILDHRGRLMGIVFCTLATGKDRVFNEISMAINIALISRELWYFLKKSQRGKYYKRIINKTEVLSINEESIQ